MNVPPTEADFLDALATAIDRFQHENAVYLDRSGNTVTPPLIPKYPAFQFTLAKWDIAKAGTWQWFDQIETGTEPVEKLPAQLEMLASRGAARVAAILEGFPGRAAFCWYVDKLPDAMPDRPNYQLMMNMKIGYVDTRPCYQEPNW